MAGRAQEVMTEAVPESNCPLFNKAADRFGQQSCCRAGRPESRTKRMATTANKTTPTFVYLGRILLTLAFFALLGAWLTQLTGGALLGFTQQHLFSDAIVLALLGIGSFLDVLAFTKSLNPMMPSSNQCAASGEMRWQWKAVQPSTVVSPRCTAAEFLNSGIASC